MLFDYRAVKLASVTRFESGEKRGRNFRPPPPNFQLERTYKETESDIIYQVRLKGREAYLVILLEFQSTVGRFMALRMLNYLTNFYMDYVESQVGVSLLPPVFPLVLYNGDRRWTAPVSLAELIQEPELLGKYSNPKQVVRGEHHDVQRLHDV